MTTMNNEDPAVPLTEGLGRMQKCLRDVSRCARMEPLRHGADRSKAMNYTPTGRTQRIVARSVLGDGWTELDVQTVAHGQMESRTTIKATKGAEPFVDIAIEEYTGTTRRAKMTSVRLQEEAARKLYAALAIKFGGA